MKDRGILALHILTCPVLIQHIYLLHKYLPNTSFAPGTVVGARDAAGSKKGTASLVQYPCLHPTCDPELEVATQQALNQ